MGQAESRDVIIISRPEYRYNTPLWTIFVNFVSVGFVLGLWIHEHDVAFLLYYGQGFWQTLYGIYFSWYVFTWFVVYVSVYLLVTQYILKPVINVLVGYREEVKAEVLLELVYGLWSCGQIVGAWMNWAKDLNCKYDDCEGRFMQSIINSMQSGCEYVIGYNYDPKHDLYYRNELDACYSIFHALPSCIMTVLSTGLFFLLVPQMA